MITWSSTALPALEHNAMLWNMMPRQKQKFVEILTINLDLKPYFFFIADYRQWAEQCIIQNIVCAVFSVFFQSHHKNIVNIFWKTVKNYILERCRTCICSIVESVYCSNNPSTHSDPSYSPKFLNPDFSIPLWQVLSKCKQTFSLILLCVKLVISYLAEIVSVKVLIPEVNVNCSRKLKLKVCWPRISSFSFTLQLQPFCFKQIFHP